MSGFALVHGVVVLVLATAGISQVAGLPSYAEDVALLSFNTSRSLLQTKTGCLRGSYGRGAGNVVSYCTDGRVFENGLCYNACPTGYTGNGPLCLTNCPNSFRNDPLHCGKPAAYGRGAGYPWKFGDGFNLNGATSRCNSENSQGCETCGAIVYPRCAANFHTVGCNICSPDCPSNTVDIGVSCQKGNQPRGVGRVAVCQPNQDQNVALCYSPCSSGYDGIGPVCWQQCPASRSYKCGPFCTASSSTCSSVLGSLGASAAAIAASIAAAGGCAAAVAPTAGASVSCVVAAVAGLGGGVTSLSTYISDNIDPTC